MEEIFVVIARSNDSTQAVVSVFGPFYTRDGAMSFIASLEAISTDYLLTVQTVREPAEVL